MDLATTGSATGGGTVNFVNGVGTAVLENTVSEIIDINLSNPSNTSLAAKDSRKIKFHLSWKQVVFNISMSLFDKYFSAY